MYDDSAAITYRDGKQVHALHGIAVPENVVVAPDKTTVDEITEEDDIDVRRTTIERFGSGRYMKALGATMVDADDCGTLWRAKEETMLYESHGPSFHPLDPEPITTVQVTNSTPEPDGSFRDFWLRVPPRK